MNSSAGADVYDIVRRKNSIFIVFDDDNGVAGIAELQKRLNEAIIIARMQADSRLIEHIERTDETGTKLRCQADALRFPARERVRAAIERKVFDADIEHELQPVFDFLQNNLGNGLLSSGELELEKKIHCVSDRKRGEVHDVYAFSFSGLAALIERRFHIAQENMERFIAQTRALALRAWLIAKEMFRAEAVTFRAGAVGRVKREKARLNFRIGKTIIRTHELSRNELLFEFAGSKAGRFDAQQAVRLMQSALDRFCQPLADIGFRFRIGKFSNEKLIDKHIDVMLFIFREDDLLAEFFHFSIDFHFLVAFAEKIIEELIVFAFAADDDRRKDADLQIRDLDTHDLFAMLGVVSISDRVENCIQNLFL